MRIENILRRQFDRHLEGIHSARISAVLAAACALVRGGRISLTSIGRSIATETSHKHGIKRVDRLLGNHLLWKQRMIFFRAVARRVVPARSRPTIIVDWTSFSGTMWSLVAAVSFEGRALVIYSETHPVSRYIKPAVNRRFLRRLRDILPAGCVPIIITDAGFRSPWMKEVASLGWDYICRVRGLNRLRQPGAMLWHTLHSFFTKFARGPIDFGQYEIGLRARFRARIIGFRKRQKIRRGAPWREKWGSVPRTDINKALRGAKEPWILATSLQSSPKKIVAHYQRRMQIEETFRDAKNTRFGFSMVHARTHSEHRADILTLLACIAHLLTVLAGIVADARGLARGYQANTLRVRRVFSLSRLGRLLIASPDVHHLNSAALSAAWTAFRARLKPLLDQV